MSVEQAKSSVDPIVDPIPSWSTSRNALWGEDNEAWLIAEWFDEGEALQHCDKELLIEEPDRWERAFDWLRSLAVAALRPA